MQLRKALESIFYTLFWAPEKRFYLSSYLDEDVKNLLANLSGGEEEVEKLIQRERSIRRPLDDGGYFNVQNDIALLRFLKAIFAYAKSNNGEVNPEFISEANKIMCGNHVLMDFGGYLGQLANLVEGSKS